MIPHGTNKIAYKIKKFFEGKKKKHYFFLDLHKKKGILELVDTG